MGTVPLLGPKEAELLSPHRSWGSTTSTAEQVVLAADSKCGRSNNHEQVKGLPSCTPKELSWGLWARIRHSTGWTNQLKEKAQGARNFRNTGISRDVAVEEPEPLGLFTDKLSDELCPAKGILTISESQKSRRLCP